ncbi:MAG: DNA polymerase III subunit delta [bacterium]|nr:DNA polymerase III subunit delta [bacterium]
MKNLFLFTGPNAQALQDKLRHWRREFVKKHSDTNLEVFEAVKESDMPRVLTALESQPFLAERRMTIIHNLPAPVPAGRQDQPDSSEPDDAKTGLDTDGLQKVLEDLPESALVIFVSPKPDKRTRLYKFLAKEAQVEPFEVLKGAQLKTWASSRLKQQGKTIDSRALDLLLFACSDDPSRLAGELEKLALLGNSSITSSDVEQLVVSSPEAKIFVALDLIGRASLGEVLRSFSQLLRSGEALPMTFFMIVRQFRLLLQCRVLLDAGQDRGVIQRRMKFAPFQVGLYVQQAQRFSLAQLKSAYHQLAEIDRLVKTGKVPFTSGREDLFQLKIDQLFCSLYEQIS